ncbi:MAG: hypothetical protein S4CHLAM7_09270 [Chlamydiae bacterium]|nr:hypothetical protein [Chlamydiota bacterium]
MSLFTNDFLPRWISSENAGSLPVESLDTGTSKEGDRMFKVTHEQMKMQFSRDVTIAEEALSLEGLQKWVYDEVWSMFPDQKQHGKPSNVQIYCEDIPVSVNSDEVLRSLKPQNSHKFINLSVFFNKD